MYIQFYIKKLMEKAPPCVWGLSLSVDAFGDKRWRYTMNLEHGCGAPSCPRAVPIVHIFVEH